MKLSNILFSQGFGTRRECNGLVWNDDVSINGVVQDDPDADVPTDNLVLTVSGEAWPYHEKALILLNKPTGYECSLKPKHWPGVHALLPWPLRRRGVQPIGRLDQDTTGVLLLTDDGQLVHKLTSPKHHVPKVYEVTTKYPVTPDQCAALLKGVVLNDDPEPVLAEGVEVVGDADACHLRLTLVQGKYHQVKRMVAAVGNRCEGLHRSAFGAVTLPPDLAPGKWCWLRGGADVFGTP